MLTGTTDHAAEALHGDDAGDALRHQVSFGPTTLREVLAPPPPAAAAPWRRGTRVVTLCALATASNAIVAAGSRGRVLDVDVDAPGVLAVAIDFDVTHRHTRVVRVEGADLQRDGDGDGLLQVGARVVCPAMDMVHEGAKVAVPRGAAGTITAVDAANGRYGVAFDAGVLRGVDGECMVACHVVQPAVAGVREKSKPAGLAARLKSKLPRFIVARVACWRQAAGGGKDVVSPVADACPPEEAASPHTELAASCSCSSSLSSSPLRSALKSRSRISHGGDSTGSLASFDAASEGAPQPPPVLISRARHTPPLPRGALRRMGGDRPSLVGMCLNASSASSLACA